MSDSAASGFEEVITVVIADDHATIRLGVHAALACAPDVWIVGEATNGLEVQELVGRMQPRVLLLDLVMPGPDPIEVEEWVRNHSPRTVTVVMSAHDNDDYLAIMQDAGAVGFLNKGESPEELIDAVRRAARGEVLFDEQQLARADRWRREVGARWNSLTEREREILRLLGQGRKDQEIAGELGLTPKTVGHHVSHILEKLQVDSRTEAAVWAVRKGFTGRIR